MLSSVSLTNHKREARWGYRTAIRELLSAKDVLMAPLMQFCLFPICCFFEILAWSQDKYIYTLAVWWNVYFCIVAQSLYHFKNTKLWRFVCTWMWDALARKVHNVNLCTNLENLYIDIILLRSTGLFDMNYTAHKTITGKCCTLPQTCFKYKGLPLNLMCNMTV